MMTNEEVIKVIKEAWGIEPTIEAITSKLTELGAIVKFQAMNRPIKNNEGRWVTSDQIIYYGIIWHPKYERFAIASTKTIATEDIAHLAAEWILHCEERRKLIPDKEKMLAEMETMITEVLLPQLIYKISVEQLDPEAKDEVRRRLREDLEDYDPPTWNAKDRIDKFNVVLSKAQRFPRDYEPDWCATMFTNPAIEELLRLCD